MHSTDRNPPFLMHWLVVALCFGTIIVGHLLEEARGHGWTSSTFPNHWECIYQVADTSVALAFAILTCWTIWLSRNGLVTLLVPTILGFCNWGETELKSRAFFDAFLQTIDWWQWAAIDAALAILVAIVLKPIAGKLQAKHGNSISELSIADLFLAVLASAVLIVAARSIATLPLSADNPDILFCGWGQTLFSCLTAALMGVIAATALYCLIAGNWIHGLLVYVAAWLVYVGASRTVTTSNQQLGLGEFKLSNFGFSFDDPLLAVLVSFAVGAIAIRCCIQRCILDGVHDGD